MQLPRTPAISGLDTPRLDELRDLDPGQPAYIDRAIGNFRRNSEQAPEVFRSHILNQDAAALRAASHRLLGSALNLGVTVAVEPLRALETIADQHTTDGALELIPEVDRALRHGRELLSAYRESSLRVVAESHHG